MTKLLLILPCCVCTALSFLLAGCSTPKKLDYPEPDRLSQQDQMNRKLSRLTKSPYTRSGL